MEEIKDRVIIESITSYIGVWMWRVFGVIFLSFSFLFFSLNKLVYAISFLIVFFICEFTAYKRKGELIK